MDKNNSSDLGSILMRLISSIDLVLIVTLILLLSLGSITLFSASGENMKMMNNHTIHLILATVVMLIASQLSSELLNR